MRIIVSCACLAVVASLAACTEKPQTLTSRKADTSASQGTGNQFVAPGWKAGDPASWDEQMRTRTQRGQNEYTRVAAGG
ncbi:MAG: hypothetical protein Q8M01_15560 [Rubrivivax sp.]|nr:hypothetical protein [Rubrivivax sp.]